MSDIAIRAEGLSKRYRIGRRMKYKAIRDVLAETITAPFRSFSKFRGNSLRESPNQHDDLIWALRDVSLEIRHGETMGIIGRNGAGKSTLLKLLSRITAPTSGNAYLHGRVGSLLEVGTGFHPELTGRENIFLNGAILGLRKREILRKFDEIVDFAEVEKFIDTPVKYYSSGMYVRLAFAVAAHLETEILLVDEVLAVGDVSFQKKCLGKMGNIAREGRTVLFVSHNLGAMKSLCPHGLLLENGRLISIGPMNEVAGRYLSMSALLGSSSWAIADNPKLPLQVIRVEAVNSHGETCDRFDVKDQIDLIVTHRCKQTLVGAVVLLCLYYNGVELIHSFDTDAFPKRLASRESGEYVDRVSLPAGLFKPGSLTLSIRTAAVNKNTTFQDQIDVIHLAIDDLWEDTSFKGYASNRTGLLRVLPLWTPIKSANHPKTKIGRG